MDSINSSSINNLPKLKGTSNYREWRFRVDLAIRHTLVGVNKKKVPDDLEIKNMNLVVNSIGDNILGNVMHCKTVDIMLSKLEQLYGYIEDDKDQF